MLTALGLILATEEEEAVSTGGGVGMGALVLTLAVVVLLAWMAYLFLNTRQRRAAANEALPPNMSQPISDEELENTKLTKVLRAALFGSILLAIVLPWYAVNEPDRQATAAETIAHEDAEAGEHWYSLDGFQCVTCHGPGGSGGATDYVEDRSGVTASWKVPSLNDVFYRYTEEEVAQWIIFGRAGTPMPANGLEGGGAMTVQEVDQVIAYLQSIQLPQNEALAKAESAAELAVAAIQGGETTTQSLIDTQQAKIDDVLVAPSQLAVVGTFPDDIRDVFQAPETCTGESAAIVFVTCDNPAPDADRDGLSDAAEAQLTAIAAASVEALPNADPASIAVYEFSFDPLNAFTNEDPEVNVPLPDLDSAQLLLSALDTEVLLLNVTVDRADAFLVDLEYGLEFLLQAAEAQLWDVDFDAAAEAMDVPVEDAMEAAGLFNAYCARCHTGGYSAGSAFEQGTGSGAWGPALFDGRTVIQFPTFEGHFDFIVNGSEAYQKYGVNGLGTGRMPAFGQILTDRQIELIVKYERSL